MFPCEAGGVSGHVPTAPSAGVSRAHHPSCAHQVPPTANPPEPGEVGSATSVLQGPPGARHLPRKWSPSPAAPAQPAIPAQMLHRRSTWSAQNFLEHVTGPSQPPRLDEVLGCWARSLHPVPWAGRGQERGTRPRTAQTRAEQHDHKAQFRESEVSPGRGLPPRNMTIGSLSSGEERHILTIFMSYLIE